ncbi:MAG: hypothetical protein IJL24_03510 [Treponema sp.]|nr:hypothetical protein [Treponema sp.]
MNRSKVLGEFLLLAKHERLPSKKKILDAAKRALFVLETEEPSYRERIPGTDVAGGLLDFRALDERGGTNGASTALATIIVPDIHARPEFIYNILNCDLSKIAPFFAELSESPAGAKGAKGAKVVDALEENKVRVICVGDILHAEGRARERWAASYCAFEGGVYDSPSMREEMAEGLAALLAVMKAKYLWPKNFHCLKGNHENIANERGEGNFPFRKFASEGQMVFEFMKAVYGKEVLDAVYEFEKALPLCACAGNFFVSHAEPMDFYSREDLVAAPLDERTVYGLTWTANDEARLGGVDKILTALCKPPKGVEARAIGGHRPVPENYLERQGGLYVQIHNPKKQNIAVVMPDKTFDPNDGIMTVEE